MADTAASQGVGVKCVVGAIVAAQSERVHSDEKPWAERELSELVSLECAP